MPAFSGQYPGSNRFRFRVETLLRRRQFCALTPRRNVGIRAPINAFGLVAGRRSLAGSMIGGIAETQEMLDFCGEHGITSDIETVNMQDVNAAYERVLKSDVRYRFVIDMKSLQAN